MKHLVALLAVLFTGTAFGQVYSNKPVGKKNQALVDSLKKAEYPYALPIWGEKAAALGFDLPYSAGISSQYLWSNAPLTIDNLLVGFNGGTMYDLDGLVRFDKSVATAEGITVRPDVWLLPFLNVYGIFGRVSGSTEVGYGLWLPDTNGVETQVFRADSKVEFTSSTFGLGITPTIGVGGGWLALDMNMTWNDVPQLDKPAFAFVFGPRMGKMIKLKKPESNINLWVGGFRLHLNSQTTGSVALGDVMPVEEWNERIEAGYTRVEELYQQVDVWWNGLTPLEQANPLNEARYNAANAALERTSGLLESADRAVSTASTSTVEYSLDKRQENMWNILVGGQYQVNKHWQFRAEYGFLTARTQFLAGVQYRFGL